MREMSNEIHACLQLPIPLEIFHIGSLDSLLEVLGTVAGRVASDDDAAQAWSSWMKIAELLHLKQEQLLVSLCPHTKAFLFWLETASAGCHPVHFKASTLHLCFSSDHSHDDTRHSKSSKSLHLTLHMHLFVINPSCM